MNYFSTLCQPSSLAVSILLICFLFKAENAQSCIDPDTVITVTANYNSEFTEVELRLGNLKLMTEAPNRFCSCALGSFSEFFTYLEYVAFVNTGTNTPYPNMAPWENTQAVDDAWNNALPSYGDWTGFIGDVINGGLAPQDDVELIIRASTPPGLYVSVSELDSMLSFSYLGTDAWNPDEEDLFADHQGIRNLRSDISSIEYNEVDDAYFTALDNAILTKTNDVEPLQTFEVNPNPIDQYFQITYSLREASDVQIRLLDLNGKLVYRQSRLQQVAGLHQMTIQLSEGVLQKGMYILEVAGKNERGIQKIVSGL